MSHGDGAKAARYIAQLYEARSNGQWQEVPELARKVEKHAPTRKCLTLAARANAIMNHGNNSYRQAESQYGSLLSAALEQEQLHRDILDGLVARAAMYYGTGQKELALKQIPDTLHRSPPPEGVKGENAWFALCVMQGTLIRGLALESLGRAVDAATTYRSIIAYISRVVALRSPYLELNRWAEELLSHICLFFSMETEEKPAQLGEAMATFHLLSKFLDIQAWRPLGTRASITGHPPRAVWRAFYQALSRIVEEDLVYHPSPVYRDHDTPEHRGLLEDADFLASRMQQRADLRRVEANYESLLLQETHFPKASESNEEVKGWIELVMSNWRTLCGPHWTDAELGGGGKFSVGRSTLDILYRAATKTFHSTQILRHLFVVHAFLGEFDLAFKAFDSYVEIITKGKARAEKSGDAGLDIDNDETAVLLAVEAIRISCRYGSEAAATKALQIGGILQKWLEKVSTNSDSLVSTARNGDIANSINPNKTTSANLSVAAVSLAYHSIGISQGNYARLTHDPVERAELQGKAVENLNRSLELNSNDAECTDTLYALGLLLAERRDIPGAIQAVRRALANAQEAEALMASNGDLSDDQQDVDISKDDSYIRERKLLPVWHLLVLLLCAREDFETASISCDAAFEQFGDAMTLFGQVGDAGLSKQSLQNPSPTYGGVVDRMDIFEKQAMLEIKMTQVSLLETSEGAEIAVNASAQLIGLYVRFFGKVDFGTTKTPRFTSMVVAQKSASGTVRSKLGRPKPREKIIAPKPQKTSYVPTSLPDTSAALASRPATNSGPEAREKRMTMASHERLRPQSGHEDGIRRSGSMKQAAFGSIRSQQGHIGINETTEKQYTDGSNSINSSPVVSNHSVSRPPRSDSLHPVGHIDDDLRAVAVHTSPHGNHVLPETNLPTSMVAHLQPPVQDGILPTAPVYDSAIPSPQFTKLQERRHKVSLLIKVWLFVAGLYRRASLFEEARQAIDEANTLVTSFELEVSKKSSSVRNFQQEGWGRGQSVDQLWADVFTERGNLYNSELRPHDALEEYEQALSFYPDHVEATVFLSNILLDIYCDIIPSEKTDPSLSAITTSSTPRVALPLAQPPQTTSTQQSETEAARVKLQQPSPPELYRLVARDRAYGIMSAVTKLGSGWDNSDAWFTLARAYEESGQLEKAKEALWWTVELEDTTPIRHWRNVGPGGFAL